MAPVAASPAATSAATFRSTQVSPLAPCSRPSLSRRCQPGFQRHPSGSTSSMRLEFGALPHTAHPRHAGHSSPLTQRSLSRADPALGEWSPADASVQSVGAC
ncbi:catalytic domain of component of various dehydrogenase complex [Trichinella spiralis]|uniref:catalytic domain of component of various dehydrogenase complex n=1 Tax=Trichinella spiralis TaxID=6334 RepID=UPI0001EFEFD6|nr:catalytic domain of component of various dehydrogenase complex [Trichinella spiralis]